MRVRPVAARATLIAASTASAPPVREERHVEAAAGCGGKRLGEPRGVRRRTRVTQVQRLLVEQRVQPRDQARMVVPDVDAAEAGEQIEILASLVVPHAHAARAREDAAVPERRRAA